MKTVELCSASTTMNINILSEYVEKKRNIIYAQHQIMMIRYIAFKKYQQDTNMIIIIRITQHEL